MAQKSIIRPQPSNYFSDWKERESLAEAMIPLIGALYRRNIHVTLYDAPLINHSVLDIMQAHRQIRQLEHNELSEYETTPILKELAKLDDMGYAHIDIAKLAVRYQEQKQLTEIMPFLRYELKDLIGKNSKPIDRHRDVVLYGFGRIGRLIGRILIENTGGGDALRWRAFVYRGEEGNAKSASELSKRANLFTMDSVHGRFAGTLRVEESDSYMVANGNRVHGITCQHPEDADYESLGIENAIIVDNTGRWRDRESLSKHLSARGAKQVLLTAPGKADVKNIVYGINHDLLKPNESIVAAASCTTNAIVPPLKVIDEHFGIEHGHVETVHAYTNDQNLIDNYHKAKRRGRSAALNLVLTETGAATAVAQVLPQFKGKLTGNAIRVPVPNVSMAILHLQLKHKVTCTEINEFMRDVALHSTLHEQIGFTDSDEMVSSDFIGSKYACVYDAGATIADGKNCTIYIWYDNEYGYAWQVYRLLEEMAGVRYPVYPNKG